jgi:beta-galactosidase
LHGQNSDYWITAWSGKDAGTAHPHRLVIDFGKRSDVTQVRYVPRQGRNDVTGRIRHYRVYVGDALVTSN